MATKEEIRSAMEMRNSDNTPSLTKSQITSNIVEEGSDLSSKVQRAIDHGVSREQALNFFAYGRVEGKAKEPNKGIFQRIGDDIKERSANVGMSMEKEALGEQSRVSTAFQTVGEAFGLAFGDVPGEGVASLIAGSSNLIDFVSDITPEFMKESIRRDIRFKEKGKKNQRILESKIDQAGLDALASGKSVYGEFKSKNPVAAENLEAALNIFLSLPVAKIGKEVIGATGKLAKRGLMGMKPVAGETVDQLADRTIVEAISDSTAKSIRDVAEATKPGIGFREKIAGVRPDIKRRIAGKKKQLQEYFDIAHARNLDDTVPTPLEFAAKKVEDVRDKLQSSLNDTGSKIGKFRKKVATMPVEFDDISSVESTFRSGVDSMRLRVKNGKIVRRAGSVQGGISDSEVKIIQTIYDDLLTVKQSPTVQNLIDLRNSIDSRINFAKSAREASNAIDPLSRKVRSTIRDVNLKIVGNEQGELLAKYSDLVSVLDEINGFVDSKSGGEFLLKRVLSERGRVPREIIRALSEETGIDLMDDAVMSQLATDIVGNTAQKGLFRQEVSKAGIDVLDVVDVATGYGPRAARALLDITGNAVAPIERTFLEAAK